MSAADRRPPRPQRPGDARRTLRALSIDPDYLRIKAEVGEPLTPAERAILDAARSVGPLKPIAREGGAPP